MGGVEGSEGAGKGEAFGGRAGRGQGREKSLGWGEGSEEAGMGEAFGEKMCSVTGAT